LGAVGYRWCVDHNYRQHGSVFTGRFRKAIFDCRSSLFPRSIFPGGQSCPYSGQPHIISEIWGNKKVPRGVDKK